MKLFLICIYDFLSYLRTKGTKSECKTFIISLIQILSIAIYSVLTAPLIWPIYYLMRFHLYNKINIQLERYDTHEVFNVAKAKLNIFEYFIFLYGDKYSPLCNKLPDFINNKYKNKSNFYKWFIFSAIRNPFFNYHYCYMQTKNEVLQSEPIKLIIDNRTKDKIHSDGISDVNVGKYFLWRKDKTGIPYFIYRNNTSKYLFYFEYCGLETLYNYPSLYCRLEIGIRKIK